MGPLTLGDVTTSSQKAYLGLQREVALLLHSRKARISREPPFGKTRIPGEVEADATVEDAPAVGDVAEVSRVEEQFAVGTLRYCFDCQTAYQV